MIYEAYIFIVFQLIICCNGVPTDSETAQAFINNNIVPNIISTAPYNFIKVNYSGVEVNLGNRFNPLQTLSQPNIAFDVNDTELYTFEMFGPDLPIDIIPPYTQLLHWMIVNIPGNNIQKGDEVSNYIPPVPYPGGFPYIFLLFKQTVHIDPNPLKSLSFVRNRPHFDAIKFQKTYNLIGPISGNFMKEVYLPPITLPSN